MGNGAVLGRLGAICGLVVTALIAAACGGGSGRALVLFAYEDSMRDEVITPFERRHRGTSVRRVPYASNDEAITKLRAGFRADVIEVCAEDTEEMIRLGLLRPLDTDRLRNWEQLFPGLRDAEGVRFRGKVWFVPSTAGAAGVVYDPDRAGRITSYADLFDPRLRGVVGLEDNALTTIAVTALALGYEDPFDLDDVDLDRVRRKLVEAKGNLRTLYRGDSDFLNLFRGGEIAAGFGYPDFALTLTDEGARAAFADPREGRLTWICGFGIGRRASNLRDAYAMLDWQTSPTVQRFFVEEYHYLVSNRRTVAQVDGELVRRLGLDRPERLAEAIPLRRPTNYDRWLATWREFKAR